ncbi:MAG: phage tail tip lysozyme [Bacteroidia bacterium]
MGIFSLFKARPQRAGMGVVRHQHSGGSLNMRSASLLGAVILASNLITLAVARPGSLPWKSSSASSYEVEVQKKEDLYLIDKASQFIPDTRSFAEKVKKVAVSLDVPAEWLMAVMYTESRFNPRAKNLKGSGAVGLIQWMPSTARDLGTSTEELLSLTAEGQLEYLYAYVSRVRNKYGDFNSLTELYLAILYPKAISQDYCYTLFSKPARAYRQNSGLDENKDGRVTVSDIDRRMQRIFPTAYLAAMADD